MLGAPLHDLHLTSPVTQFPLPPLLRDRVTCPKLRASKWHRKELKSGSMALVSHCVNQRDRIDRKQMVDRQTDERGRESGKKSVWRNWLM